MYDSEPPALQVGKHKDPQDACLAVVVESYKSWLATEARTDDITVIVIQFELGEGLTCALLSAMLLWQSTLYCPEEHLANSQQGSRQSTRVHIMSGLSSPRMDPWIWQSFGLGLQLTLCLVSICCTGTRPACAPKHSRHRVDDAQAPSLARVHAGHLLGAADEVNPDVSVDANVALCVRSISKTPSSNSLTDSRSNSVRGGTQPGVRRIQSQKSLRKVTT